MTYLPTNSALPVFTNLFDELFNDVTRSVGSNQTKAVPATNIRESAEAYFIELAIPGVAKDKVKIDLEEDTLTISAVTEKEEEAVEGYKRREFNYSSFSKVFTVPEAVDAEAIGANFENGVLTLTLPKLPEVQPVKRSIAIA